MIYRCRRSSNANEVRDLAITFGAQPFDNDEVLRAFEVAVFLTMDEDAMGDGVSDKGQPH